MGVGAMPSKGNSEHDMARILNSLDAVVYVSDIETYELLFINDYARQTIAGSTDPELFDGKRCWQVLQAGQDGPCSFCSNPKLPSNGDVYVWEFKNTRNGLWYQCRDRLIDWHDGRRVRLEVAADINYRKEVEEALEKTQKELRYLAEIDSLTQIYNRRAFMEQAEQFRRSLPHNACFGIFVFDLDYFKQVNDVFGHDAGDALLAQLGAQLKDYYQNSSVLGRLGGEEFAVAFSCSGEGDVTEAADQLLNRIAAVKVDYEGQLINCTASIGVCLASAGEESLKSLLKSAD